MSCTDQTSATSYADQVIAGGLIWSTPANASVGAPYASSGYYGLGSFSDWLAGASFVPAAPIPGTAVLTGANVTVRQRCTGGVLPYPARLAQIEVFVSGVLKQTLNVNTLMPQVFTDFAYALDLGLLGLTVALANAGAVTARIRYDVGAVVSGYTDPTNPSDPHYTSRPVDRYATTEVVAAPTAGTGSTYVADPFTTYVPSTVDVEALSLQVCYEGGGGMGAIALATLKRIPPYSETIL